MICLHPSWLTHGGTQSKTDWTSKILLIDTSTNPDFGSNERLASTSTDDSIRVSALAYPASGQETDHWESVVLENDTWRYIAPTSEPALSWRALSFDAQTWEAGPADLDMVMKTIKPLSTTPGLFSRASRLPFRIKTQ